MGDVQSDEENLKKLFRGNLINGARVAEGASLADGASQIDG